MLSMMSLILLSSEQRGNSFAVLPLVLCRIVYRGPQPRETRPGWSLPSVLRPVRTFKELHHGQQEQNVEHGHAHEHPRFNGGRLRKHIEVVVRERKEILLFSRFRTLNVFRCSLFTTMVERGWARRSDVGGMEK